MVKARSGDTEAESYGTGTKNTARNSKYLSQRAMNSVLDIVGARECLDRIGGDSTLLCAVGGAMAFLATHQIFAEMAAIMDQFDACSGEMRVEDDFTVKKVEEHINILLDLNSEVSRLVNCANSPCEGRGDFVRSVFCTLPGGDVVLLQKLAKVQRALEEQIIRSLRRLLRDVDKTASGNSEGRIRPILIAKASELAELGQKVQNITEEVSSIVEGVRLAWNDHIGSLVRRE